MSEMFEEILKNIKDTDPAKKAVQKLLLRLCSERDISSQEVLHLATGKKLFSCSRAFVKVNFTSSEWIPIVRPVRNSNGDVSEVMVFIFSHW